MGINTSVRQNTGNDVLLRDFQSAFRKTVKRFFPLKRKPLHRLNKTLIKTKKGFSAAVFYGNSLKETVIVIISVNSIFNEA